jgi:hypothetical protein
VFERCQKPVTSALEARRILSAPWRESEAGHGRAGELVDLHRDRDQRDHRAQQRGRLPEDEQAQLATPPQEIGVDRKRAQDLR